MLDDGTVANSSLLIEFLTEELPPINLENHIGKTFAANLCNELSNFLLSNTISYKFFVTPRRFGLIINNICAIEPEQIIKRKGPAIASGLKNNEPTQALIGFLKSANIASWQDLEQNSDGYFYTTKKIPGQTLETILPSAITLALKNLPIAKHMRWGNNDYTFVRPVQNLVIMYNNQVICKDSCILGCSPVNYTFGHRILSPNPIYIDDIANYIHQMDKEGQIIVDFQVRKENISDQLHKTAEKLDLKINDISSLLDEVTALVEHPVVLQGEFAIDFLQVPQECLILSMAKNQKYFALLNKEGKLSNKFLFVANITSTNPNVIISGNEKVLAARLSDAKFFYEIDKKHNLKEFVAKLEKVVYHNKLGSQLQRINRLQAIAGKIAPLLGIDSNLAQSTAYLLKADLTTEMVGEFPELQGVMGKYYALASSEPIEVANAIEKHYYPRFSGDALPDTTLAITMALADKLETLVGIWGIGLIPTGEKDPFALRRIALGIIRILLTTNLKVDQLLDLTFETFVSFNLNPNTKDEVYNFILQRLENYLTKAENHSPNLVQSVLALRPLSFDHLPSLLEALQPFSVNNKPLLNANKRISNILEKNKGEFSTNAWIKEEYFTTTEEKVLFKLFNEEKENIQIKTNQKNWEELFTILAKFNQVIADFFENVMVMDKDENIRNNRITLLQHLYANFNQVCKLSLLN